MLEILKNRSYALLFSAQIVSLLGTGLMTIALGLLAFDLAGPAAGAVLGTAYVIKMVAYVGLSPVLNAALAHMPRKVVLIGADLLRAAIVLALPFVSEVWQIFVLIFVLQTASASFTPVYQALLPDVLPDEDDYTRALSLSRLAYDVENLLSPVLAALLLVVMSYSSLFMGTVAGFVLSAILVKMAVVPPLPNASTPRPFRDRLTRGSRIYLATPRLRGLLALNLTAAAIGAFVLVNSVVVVRAEYGLTDRALGIAMAAYGGGSMVMALLLPRFLSARRERDVMLPSAIGLSLVAALLALWLILVGLPAWSVFLALWFIIGAGYSAILTPSGRLLRISAHAEDRPAVFAAQFALSHLCWLVAYALAGWVGQWAGQGAALLVLSFLAGLGVIAARAFWPAQADRVIVHSHPDLPPDHPHLRAHGGGGADHAHVFVIDDEHRVWPTQG